MTALFSESHVDIFGTKFVEKYDKCSLIIFITYSIQKAVVVPTYYINGACFALSQLHIFNLRFSQS